MSFWIDSLTTITKIRPILYAVNPTTGIPNSVPLDSGWWISTIDLSQQRQWQKINLRRGNPRVGLMLNPGKYWLGLIQKQGFMSIGYNSQTAEVNTIWQKINALGTSSWTKTDTAGQLLLVANFGLRIFTYKKGLIESNSRPHLYPNPVQDQLVVEWLGFRPKDKLQIFNSLGQKIREEDLTSSRFIFSTNRLPKGIYVIRIGKIISSFVKE